MNPRKMAVEILVESDQSSEYLENILHRRFSHLNGTNRDKRFIQELVFGTTRWRNKLDFTIETQYQGQYHKAEYIVKALLRSGLYQMLMMDSVPEPVAINETVELAKTFNRKRVSGLINGVLRSIKRNRDSIQSEILSLDDVRRISVAQSHPEWLVERWIERYGTEDALQLCLWDNQAPPVTIRVNTTEIGVSEFSEQLIKQNIVHKRSRVLQEFFILDQAQQVLQNKAIDTKWYAVQDQAAGLAASLVEPKKNDIVLDCCAAPGGKTTFLAQRFPEHQVQAFDVNAERLGKVNSLLNRLNLSNVLLEQADATTFDFPVSDWALLDVPCTGTGVLGKRVDARWRRIPDDIPRMVETQSAILQNVARAMNPGGVMVYSTCTLEPEENWGVVKKFLEQNTEFSILPLPENLPGNFRGKEGALKVLPHKHHMDGAFAVRLQRENNS